MKENIEELRANVERTEMAGLKFIATRVACARAALDYIAQLEQTSRAQRTNEGKCNSAAAPAAGQAGLASELQKDIDSIADELEQEASNYEGDFADTVNGCADALRQIAERAAPVAADTEQATDEQLAKDAARYRWLRHADLDALAAGNWGTGQVYEGVKFDDAIDRAMDAAPLATPADAGAGQIDERAEFEKAMNFHYADLERTKDGAYAYAATRTAWLAWQARARLSTPGAPVTAEPVAWLRWWARQFDMGHGNIGHEEGFETCKQGELSDDGSPAFPVYAAPVSGTAPADRDAIRNEALEEAADVADQFYHHIRQYTTDVPDIGGAILKLKSMERAADAAETRDAKGGKHG